MLMFVLKIFGIYAGYSVIRFYFRRNLLGESEMTKIVSVYFAIQVVLIIFFRDHWWQFTGVFVPIFLFLWIHFIFMCRLENRFREEFPALLTQMILHMKSGKSFRSSFTHTLQRSPMRYQKLLSMLFDHVVFLPQKSDKKMAERSLFLQQTLQILRQVDQSQHRHLEKLENYRRRLSLLNEFRRRSGQIRSHVHMQCWVLGVIYSLSLAFVVYQFGVHEFLGLILCSLAVFLVGIVFTILLGRRVKWKI